MTQRTLKERAGRYAASQSYGFGNRQYSAAGYLAGYRAAQRDQNRQKDRPSVGQPVVPEGSPGRACEARSGCWVNPDGRHSSLPYPDLT